MTSGEQPSRIISKPQIVDSSQFGLAWECAEYYGQLRNFPTGDPFQKGPWAILSITATDESSRHDWREFQQLKNYLVGKEWEAIELYPAESRLIDPSNRFYLFCFPKGVLSIGLPQKKRHVVDADKSLAPQRPFTTQPQEPKP